MLTHKARIVIVACLVVAGCRDEGKKNKEKTTPQARPQSPQARPQSPQARPQSPRDSGSVSRPGDTQMTSKQLPKATDGRLEIRLEFKKGVVRDRALMRTMVLHFRNVSKEPVRIYLIKHDYFRAITSNVSFYNRAEKQYFSVPGRTRRHGYQVTEKDFHLLKPGESRAFTQRFTIDPFREPRKKGFEKGKKVEVDWTYENNITQWKGGVKTFKGTTKTLFGGKKIPYIWTGKLEFSMTWTVPD